MNVTLRAMIYVRLQWIVAGIDRDSDEDVMEVVGE